MEELGHFLVKELPILFGMLITFSSALVGLVIVWLIIYALKD